MERQVKSYSLSFSQNRSKSGGWRKTPLSCKWSMAWEQMLAGPPLIFWNMSCWKQNKFFIEQTHFQQADSLHGSAFAFSHITANASVQTHEILSLDLVEKISQHNMKRFDNQFYLSKAGIPHFNFFITFWSLFVTGAEVRKLPRKVLKIENLCNLICNLKRVRNLKMAPNIVSKIHLNHYI